MHVLCTYITSYLTCCTCIGYSVTHTLHCYYTVSLNLPLLIWLPSCAKISGCTFPYKCNIFFLLQWPSTQDTSWTLGSCLQRRVMAAFLQLGKWPPRESVERYLLCFHCSIRLCMNFLHILLSQKLPKHQSLHYGHGKWADLRSPLMFHWLPGEDWN